MRNLLIASVCLVLVIPAIASPQYNNLMPPPTNYMLNNTSPFDSFNKGFKQSQDRQSVNLEIERMKLENELLRLEVQKTKQLQKNENTAYNAKDED
ncbi:hypothetical protein ACT3TI_13520 [Psychrobacter sp. AOP22-C1-22]|uniref:hypothetical protein n=1 Tax=unclassified Psychrobacter TaxID=196806 RepID=UPI0040378D9E